MKTLHVAAIVALGLCPTSLARADVVGSVGAVNQSVQGTPPGGAASPLALGAGVVGGERIVTKADGKAQIVFLDKSTLSVGANSAVIISSFVYDPGAGAGKQSLSLVKGALRFVGGGVSHGDGMSITTRSGSIGVRGGAVLVRVDGPQGDEVVLLYGVATIVTKAGLTAQLTRPGYGVFISPDGRRISDPAPAGDETIESFERQFASAGRQRGGALVPPGSAETNAGLGDTRPPDQTPWAGLGALGLQWSGDGLTQSRAQTNDQSQATPASPAQTNDGYRSTYTDSYTGPLRRP